MARTPLKPKSTTTIRLALKVAGYDVIPLYDKTQPFKGWRTQPNNPEDIRGWGGLCTGVRMGGELLAIDLDTRTETMRDAVVGLVEEICPGFVGRAVRRHSGGTTLALFGRAVTTVKHLRSCRWREGGEEEKPHLIEVFSGHAKRQFCVAGPHSVGRVYGYFGPALWEVPISTLPLFPGDRLGELVDRCDALMKGRGLELVAEGGGGGDSQPVYDLEPGQVLRLEDGTEIELEELEEKLRGEPLAAYANIWDPGSKTPDRVKVNQSRTGLALWDSKTELSHRWAQAAPPPPLDLSGLKTLASAQEEPTAPPRPADGATLAEQVRWLLMTHGYCAVLDRVVELHRASDKCLLLPIAFGREFCSWSEISTGPRGGTIVTAATKEWNGRPERMSIRGIRMRPDRSFPIYSEDGELFKNTYRRWVHVGDGNIWPWLRFMAHLLPSRRERRWFNDWLAHKYQNPGVPGVAVIMVACDGDGPVYGAGRGILRDILARLFGTEYVRPIGFDILTGKSAQAVYTDWAAHALLVTVDESKDTAESGRWTERRAVYERLKEVVDPRAVMRTFQAKGFPAFTALCFASYLIFSNNRDSLQIPNDDRRFAALANGTRMSTWMARELQVWMEDEGNIARLGKWLGRRDLRGFNPYEAPPSETKTVMAELALTELDEWFVEARRVLRREDLFTGEQLYEVISREAGAASRSEEFTRRVRRRIRTEVKKADGFRMPDGNRAWILCWRDYNGQIINVNYAQERVNLSAQLISGTVTRIKRETGK